MMLFQDGLLAFFSAVGVTTVVLAGGGGTAPRRAPVIRGACGGAAARGEALAMEADVRELRRARNHLPGAKIVLADCGLSDDAKALAACLADRGKDVVLVDGGPNFHVE